MSNVKQGFAIAAGRKKLLPLGVLSTFGFVLPGAVGTRVISAHRDTHFRFLRRVHVGDESSVQVATGRWRRYRVATARVELEFPDLNAPQLLLVTCYPFDTLVPGGPLRYVITAVEPEPTPL